MSFSYSYDTTTANIISETRTGGSYAGTVTYVYDKLGQLKRVNDPTDPRGGENGTTWLYTYDLGGSIIGISH